MTWSHRVVRYEDGTLGIHEVYYDKNGDPEMTTMYPIGVAGDTIDDLLADLTRMIECLTQPILEYEDF